MKVKEGALGLRPKLGRIPPPPPSTGGIGGGPLKREVVIIRSERDIRHPAQIACSQMSSVLPVKRGAGAGGTVVIPVVRSVIHDNLKRSL